MDKMNQINNKREEETISDPRLIQETKLQISKAEFEISPINESLSHWNKQETKYYQNYRSAEEKMIVRVLQEHQGFL
jgi:hypothetical protein